MEMHTHTLSQLFAQLGLPDDKAAIERFITSHAPLADHLDLVEAPFWSPAQATLLRTERAKDADWVELIDSLDALMRCH
jgi:Protein of unknown function (DUF2789)